MVLSGVECEVADWKGSEVSMQGFAIKASVSEVISQWEGEKTVEVKVFLAEGCKNVCD